jgi:hypothetical protein
VSGPFGLFNHLTIKLFNGVWGEFIPLNAKHIYQEPHRIFFENGRLSFLPSP